MKITEQDRVRIMESYFKGKESGMCYGSWFDSLSPEDQATEEYLDDEFCTIAADKSFNNVDTSRSDLFKSQEEGFNILMSA